MRKLSAIAIFLIFILHACKKGNENFVSTTTLLNASYGMPPITLNLNGNAAISNVSYDSIKYNVANPSGTYALTFTASGSTIPLYSVNTGFSSGSGYTAIVYDSANARSSGDSAKLYFQKDVFPTSITNGKCSIRFFNLMRDTGAHVFVKTDTGTIGKFFISARSFGDFKSPNQFVEADTISNIVLDVVKDTTAAKVILDTYSLGFKNGKIYSLYLTGVFGRTNVYKPKLIVQQHN